VHSDQFGQQVRAGPVGPGGHRRDGIMHDRRDRLGEVLAVPGGDRGAVAPPGRPVRVVDADQFADHVDGKWSGEGGQQVHRAARRQIVQQGVDDRFDARPLASA
jgi:hypothetical protein